VEKIEKEEYMKSISFKNGIDRRQNGFAVLFKKRGIKKSGKRKEEEKVIKRIVTSWAWFVDTLYCCLSFSLSLSLFFFFLYKIH
jgi:hypothetical protein